jgi:hypothetical protein
MSTTDERDPLEDERSRARESAADDAVTAEGEGDEAVHPSLGAPPRRDESRPVFRGSQLQGDEDKPDDAAPLRG